MLAETETYDVFYEDRLHTNCDQPGEIFKYKATCISEQTGKVTNLDRESMFINKRAFIATLTRWNSRKTGNLEWWYTPAEKRKIILNGKEIEYTELTEFKIQIGKGKESYKDSRIFYGNPTSVFLHYNGINAHGGFKKRLVMQHPGEKQVVLNRVITNKDF